MTLRVTARCPNCRISRPFLVDNAGRGRCAMCGTTQTVAVNVPTGPRRLW